MVLLEIGMLLLLLCIEMKCVKFHRKGDLSRAAAKYKIDYTSALSIEFKPSLLVGTRKNSSKIYYSLSFFV